MATLERVLLEFEVLRWQPYKLEPTEDTCRWLRENLDDSKHDYEPRIAYYPNETDWIFPDDDYGADMVEVGIPAHFYLSGSEGSFQEPGLRFCPGCGRELKVEEDAQER